MNPPYKIRIKPNADGTSNNLDSSAARISGLSYIRREIKFGGSNCPLEPEIAMTLLLFDMPNFRKYLCLSP
jgi:hypothetical protein